MPTRIVTEDHNYVPLKKITVFAGTRNVKFYSVWDIKNINTTFQREDEFYLNIQYSFEYKIEEMNIVGGSDYQKFRARLDDDLNIFLPLINLKSSPDILIDTLPKFLKFNNDAGFLKGDFVYNYEHHIGTIEHADVAGAERFTDPLPVLSYMKQSWNPHKISIEYDAEREFVMEVKEDIIKIPIGLQDGNTFLSFNHNIAYREDNFLMEQAEYLLEAYKNDITNGTFTRSAREAICQPFITRLTNGYFLCWFINFYSNLRDATN